MNASTMSTRIPLRTIPSLSLSAARTQACRATRSYATASPRTPKSSTTTTTKKPAAKPMTSKTPTPTTAKAKARTSRAFTKALEEEESIAARTPLKKPSTSGLGVPSKSPSATSQTAPYKTSKAGKYVPEKDTSAIPSTAGEADQERARREMQLRTAQIRRQEDENKKKDQEEKDHDYKARYNSIKNRYVGVMIGLPILVVTSWHLWDRLAMGNQKDEYPQLEDRKLVEASK